MIIITAVVMIVGLSLISFEDGEAWITPSSNDEQPEIVVNGDAVFVSWNTPETYDVQETGTGVRFHLPGYSLTATPGQVELPYAAVLLTFPKDVQPRVEILNLEKIPIAVTRPLSVAQEPDGVLYSQDGQMLGAGTAFPGARQVDVKHPVKHPPVEFEPIGIARGIPVGRLVFYPLQQVGNDWFLIKKINIKVVIGETSQLTPAKKFDKFQTTLLAQIANAEQVTLASTPDVQSLRQETRSFPNDAGTSLIVEVDQPGVYAITYAQLSSLGYPLEGLVPSNFHLEQEGQEVDLEWEGDLDSQFELGERFLFYAPHRFNRWSVVDTYVFSYQNTPGTRMAQRNGSPVGLAPGAARVEKMVEENQFYTPSCYCAPIPAGRDGDRWVWRRLARPGGETTISETFTLADVHPDLAGEISLWLIGYTRTTAPVDHQVEVQLNDVFLGSISWDGKSQAQAVFSIPANTLIKGSNQLALALSEVPGVEIDGVWLDAFAVRYAGGDGLVQSPFQFLGEASPASYTLKLGSDPTLRIYDMTTPAHPVRIIGFDAQTQQLSFGDVDTNPPRTYYLFGEKDILEPVSLRGFSPLQSPDLVNVDEIMISPAEFIPTLAPLVSLRISQGLKVQVIDVQGIYDHYSDGRVSPDAIRDYLRDIYDTGVQKPLYVLLVGDGTYDPKDYLGIGSANFIPPYLAEVDPWAGETAADNRYAAVDGEDNLPDMLIGRLSASNLTELQTIIDKIITYEQVFPAGLWMNRMTVIADNPDVAGNFYTLASDLIQDWTPTSYRGYPLFFDSETTTANAFLEQVKNVFNDGSGFIVYFGHSSTDQWAHERLFHLDDVPGLTNSERLPVVLQMTCFTGAFQTPGPPTLDEVLLLSPNGGAVGVWGSTGLGVATGHEYLAQGFLQPAEVPATLGERTLQGRLRLAAQPSHDDLIDTFTLLGDPAMQIRTGPELVQSIYLPITYKLP